jgi:hypothetical protein
MKIIIIIKKEKRTIRFGKSSPLVLYAWNQKPTQINHLKWAPLEEKYEPSNGKECHKSQGMYKFTIHSNLI